MQINGGWNTMLRELNNQRAQRPSPTPESSGPLKKYYPPEQGLSEGHILTRNFI